MTVLQVPYSLESGAPQSSIHRVPPQLRSSNNIIEGCVQGLLSRVVLCSKYQPFLRAIGRCVSLFASNPCNPLNAEFNEKLAAAAAASDRLP